MDNFGPYIVEARKAKPKTQKQLATEKKNQKGREKRAMNMIFLKGKKPQTGYRSGEAYEAGIVAFVNGELRTDAEEKELAKLEYIEKAVQKVELANRSAENPIEIDWKALEKSAEKAAQNTKFYPFIEEIVNQIKTHPESPSKLSPAIHTGKKTTGTSAVWKKNGGKGSSEYITDMILNGQRISLKSGANAQWTGTIDKGEASALLFSVIDEKGFSNSIRKEMEGMISGFFHKTLTLAETKWFKQEIETERKRQKEAGEKVRKSKITVKWAKQFFQEIADTDKLHEELRDYVQTFFASNQDFYKAIMFEAMSGEIKFGGGEAQATHVMKIHRGGKGIEYGRMDDPKFIAKAMSETRPDISWTAHPESRSKGPSWTSVFRIYAPGLEKRLSDSEARSLAESVEMMFEGYDDTDYITEGIFMDMWTKIKEAIMSFAAMIKKWMSEAFRRILEWIGLEMTLTFK